MQYSIRNTIAARLGGSGPVQHRVRCRNLRHSGERRLSSEDLHQVSVLNSSVQMSLFVPPKRQTQSGAYRAPQREMKSRVQPLTIERNPCLDHCVGEIGRCQFHHLATEAQRGLRHCPARRYGQPHCYRLGYFPRDVRGLSNRGEQDEKWMYHLKASVSDAHTMHAA